MDKKPKQLIIWSALFASNFIYATVAFFVLPNSESESIPFVAYFLTAVGIGALAMSHIIPVFLLKTIKKEESDAIKLQKEQTFFIMGLALNESVAIFALIAKISINNNLVSAFLFAISIMGFISKFPRNEINSLGKTPSSEKIKNKRNSLEP